MSVHPLRWFRRSFRLIFLWVGVGSALACGACSNSSPPAFLGQDELSPDPFLSLDSIATPAELIPLFSQAQRAAEQAEEALEADGISDRLEILKARLTASTRVFVDERIGLIRPRTVTAPALVPADANVVCDLDTMISQFAADSRASAAFAQIQGVAVDELSDYLRSLRAGYLVDDVEVRSHDLDSASSRGYVTVLGAGTAVLTDDDGVPRVRCKGPNPLLATVVEIDDELFATSAFADEIVAAMIGADVPDLESTIDGQFTNEAKRALGPPDQIAVSLGEDPDPGVEPCHNFVVVAFVDNRLVDGPGDDLRLFELGRTESSFVAIGTSAQDLRQLGQVEGGDVSIDIASVADPGDAFAFVRICDGPETGSVVPGTDIDAVLALNSAPS